MTSTELDEYTQFVIGQASARMVALIREMAESPGLLSLSAREAYLVLATSIEQAGEGTCGPLN